MTHPSDDWRDQFAQARDRAGEHFVFDPSTTSGHVPAMTLRDWFAGMALSNALWSTLPQHAYLAEAKAFYAMADAMLAARGEER